MIIGSKIKDERDDNIIKPLFKVCPKVLCT